MLDNTDQQSLLDNQEPFDLSISGRIQAYLKTRESEGFFSTESLAREMGLDTFEHRGAFSGCLSKLRSMGIIKFETRAATHKGSRGLCFYSLANKDAIVPLKRRRSSGSKPGRTILRGKSDLPPITNVQESLDFLQTLSIKETNSLTKASSDLLLLTDKFATFKAQTMQMLAEMETDIIEASNSLQEAGKSFESMSDIKSDLNNATLDDLLDALVARRLSTRSTPS